MGRVLLFNLTEESRRKKVKAARRWRFPKGTPVGIMAKVEVEAVPDCAVRAMWCEIVAESGAK